MISEQTFFCKDKEELKTIHKPALLNLDYFIEFIQDDKKINVCLYTLKSIMRTANKNIKLIESGL